MLHALDLADARQEHQHVTGMRGEHVFDGATYLWLQCLVAARGEMRHRHRETATGAADARCIQPAGEFFAIQRRRHHHDPQVVAHAGLHIEREREPEITGQVSLVEFVEDDRAHAFQQRILLQQPGEDAFGDDFDPRRLRHLRLETDAVADRFAHRLAQLLRHETGRGPRGDATGLQHQDFSACQPRRIQQRQRQLRGLAGTRRRLQHQARMRGKRRAHLGQDGIDGECRRSHCARIRGEVPVGLMRGIG